MKDEESSHSPAAEAVDPPGPSELSEKLHRLKRAALTAADRREKLPVPLYWSLFHSQVREVRKVRANQRLLRCLLIGGE